MHNYKELNIWIKSRALVKELYVLTRKFPVDEKYGLTSQIRRAAISIPSNIAEGSGRNSNKDFARFLDMAISSAFEIETELFLSYDLGYIKEYELDIVINKLIEIQKMIYGFRKKVLTQ